jgi:hypothetical protein
MAKPKKHTYTVTRVMTWTVEVRAATEEEALASVEGWPDTKWNAKADTDEELSAECEDEEG